MAAFGSFKEEQFSLSVTACRRQEPRSEVAQQHRSPPTRNAADRRVVGYVIDSRMKASLAVRALENALAQRGYPEGKYHRKRRQRALGELTPVKFETIMRTAVGLAA